MAAVIDPTKCDRCVIFLDIDGVLLPVPRFTFGGGELSPDCVTRLARLIAFVGGPDKVTIILSSTWRNFPDSVARLNAFFEKEAAGAVPAVAGGTPNGTVIVSTVSYYADDPSEQRLVRDRVDEIYRWLHTHLQDHPEAIAGRWFAIDDMKLDVDDRMAGHFLHTATDVGITDEDVVTGQSLVALLPSPEEAVQRAEQAARDPALKDEEIQILEIQRSRLETQVGDLQQKLAASEERVIELAAAHREQEKEKKDLQRKLEDVSYRLAVYDFAKRNDTLRAAVDMAAKKTGKERKELDDAIKALVNLLRERKEVEKKVRAEAKKGQSSVEA